MKQTQDFWLWLAWLGLTLATVLGGLRYWYVINHDAIATNDYADRTGITIIILILFGIALTLNIVNTLRINQEINHLSPNRGLFQEHSRTLALVAKNQFIINQDLSLELIQNRLLRRENWVQLFAGLLITLGMVGTVLGLAIAMGSLSGSLESIQGSLQTGVEAGSAGQAGASVAGLGEALGGMSSAFITTLTGAVLGGLFLKLLSHSTINLIEDLLDQMRYKAELEVIPRLQREAWNREMNNLAQAHDSLRSFLQSSGEVERLLQGYLESMAMASSQMGHLSQDLDRMVLDHTTQKSPEAVFQGLQGSLNQMTQMLQTLSMFVIVMMTCMILGLIFLWVGN